MRRALGYVLATMFAAGAFAELKTLKPGANLFKPEQDVQLGQQAKAEIEKTKPILRDPTLDEYINNIGKRLAQSPRAGSFPFSFEAVQDKNINAFALPG